MDRDTRKRTGQDGLAAWATVAATAVAVVVVAGGAWAVTRSGDDSTSPGADPGTTPTVTVSVSSPSEPTSTDSNPTETTSTDGGHPVAWPAACTSSAKQALKAGLGVVGPAELPQGWTVLGCAFVPGPASWTVDVTSPQGPIRLVQSKGSENALVKAYLGDSFAKGESVHAAGTGSWHSWTGPQSATALSKAFAGSAVIVKGTQSASYLTDYASSLLTYERAPGGPGDDVGGGN